MEPDWPFIGKLALSVVLTSGFATGIVQLFITRRLDRQLADHQAKLQRENDAANEQLRHELQLRAHVEQVRASGLLAKRGEIVAELYRRLTDLHMALESLTKDFTLPGEPSNLEKAKAAAAALKAFAESFEPHRIFLPSPACAALDTFLRNAAGSFRKFTVFGAEWGNGVDPTDDVKHKLQIEAGKEVASQLPAMRTRVETVFRELLGEA